MKNSNYELPCTLTEVYYPRDYHREVLIESYLLEAGYSRGSLLVEKKGAFKNILSDVGQAALSTGAIAATGGAGGDVVVDVIFAAKIAAKAAAEVASLLEAAGELGSIILQAAKLDFDGSPEFEKKVQSLLALTVKNQIAGNKAKEFMADASKKINEILEKIARAVGKWVGALIPDDFGLGGPAFEALFESALKKSGENIYKIVIAGINALPMGAGKYLTDSDALEDLLETIATSMIDAIDDISEWADSQRESLEDESFRDMVGRKASAGVAAQGAIGSSIKSAAGSGLTKLAKLQAAPGAALFKVMDKISGGRLEASTGKQRMALVNALQNKGVDDRIVSQVDSFYQKYGNPIKIQDTLDQLDADQQEKFKAGVEDYIDAVKQSNKGEIMYMSDKALPAVRDFLVKFRNDWIPTTVAVMRKLMSWLMAGLVIFQELVNPEKYLKMKTKMGPLEKEMSDEIDSWDLGSMKLAAGYNRDRKMKITRSEIRQIIRESFAGIGAGKPMPLNSRADPEFALAIKGESVREIDAPDSFIDYYEDRRQEEIEQLYQEDLDTLKGIVEKYGAVDMQRIMGDVKKERYLRRYDFDDIEDMLIRLQRDDEIDYDEGSRQWVAV